MRKNKKSENKAKKKRKRERRNRTICSTSANFDFGQFRLRPIRFWPTGRSRVVRSRIGQSRASSTNLPLQLRIVQMWREVACAWTQPPVTAQLPRPLKTSVRHKSAHSRFNCIQHTGPSTMTLPQATCSTAPCVTGVPDTCCVQPFLKIGRSVRGKAGFGPFLPRRPTSRRLDNDTSLLFSSQGVGGLGTSQWSGLVAFAQTLGPLDD